MDFEKALLKFAEDHPVIFQYKLIAPEELIFSEDVIAACEKNYCGRYGKCWTCPPGAGDYRTHQREMLTYKNAFVYTTKHDIEDSFDIEGMAEAAKAHSAVNKQMREFAEANGVGFILAGAGSCDLCAECTYPDAPCRHPDIAHPSMEACGINVMELSGKIGVNYINGVNTVTYFSMLLF